MYYKPASIVIRKTQKVLLEQATYCLKRSADEFTMSCQDGHASPPIPLFVLSKRHPASPDALRYRAWWTSSTGKVADLVSPPGIGPRYEPDHEIWGTLARSVWVHPGDVHFFQDQCHPPILYPITPQRSDWTEVALIKKRVSLALCVKYISALDCMFVLSMLHTRCNLPRG